MITAMHSGAGKTVAELMRAAQMVNYKSIADDAGIDQSTARAWMNILETLGLVFMLHPYSNNVLRRTVKTPKLYFYDTGLVCYLTRWLSPETLAYGAMSGHIFETFAVSEILKSFANNGQDYRYFVSYYRGHDKPKRKIDGEMVETEGEIDLIIEADGVLYPVEIKQNGNVSPGATGAFQILDKVPDRKRGMGAVICTCPQPGQLRENVLQLPVWYI